MKFTTKRQARAAALEAELRRLRDETQRQEEALRLRNADVLWARNESTEWKNRHAEAVAKLEGLQSVPEGSVVIYDGITMACDDYLNAWRSTTHGLCAGCRCDCHAGTAREYRQDDVDKSTFRRYIHGSRG
jgi:hypothetical protein